MNVFISYDFSGDEDRWTNLKQKLEEIDSVSVLEAKAKAGELLSKDLLVSIKASDICVFICSSDSIESNWCVAEIGAFWGLEKPILAWSTNVEMEQINEKFPQSIGLTIAGSMDEIVEQVSELAKAEKSTNKTYSPPNLSVPVKSFIDAHVANDTPSNWRSRDLYIGVQGARNWLRVAADENYKPFVAARANLFAEGDPIGSLIDKAKCNSIISLGPGNAELDKTIVLRYCNQSEDSFTYYPVDINPYLLSAACHEIQSNTNAQVPFGILADFEENLKDIFGLVQTQNKGPCLYSCLGYTMGNLDLDEQLWIQTVAQKMNTGDFLLFDYLRVDDDFDFEDYEKNAYKDYTSSLRHWIAHPTSVTTGLGRNRLVDNFESAFRYSFNKSGGKKNDAIVGTRILYTGYGLEGAKMTEYKDKLVVKMHRYRTQQFIDRICQQTPLERVDHVDSTNDDGFYKSSLSLFVKS